MAIISETVRKVKLLSGKKPNGDARENGFKIIIKNKVNQAWV